MNKIKNCILVSLVFAVCLLVSGEIAALEFSLIEDREQEAVSRESIRELARIHYARARNYYRKGEYSKAKTEFEEVLKLEPEHQGARWYVQFVEKELSESDKSYRGTKPRKTAKSTTGTTSRSKSIEKKLSQEKLRRKNLEQEEAKLLRRLEEYRSEASKAKSRQASTAKETTQLRQEKEQLEKRLTEYKGALEEQGQKIKQLEKKTSKDKKAKKLKIVKAEKEDLEEQLKQVRLEQKKQKEVAEEQAASLTQIQTEKEKLEAQLQQVRLEQKDSLKQIEAEKEEIEKQLKDLRRDHQKQLKAKLKEHEEPLKDEFDKKVSKLNKKISSYESKAKEYEDKIKQLEQTTRQLGKVEREKEQSQAELAQLRQRQEAQLEEKLAKYEKRLEDEFTKKENEFNERLTRYETRLGNLKEEKEKLEKENIDTYAQVLQLKETEYEKQELEGKLEQLRGKQSRQLKDELEKYRDTLQSNFEQKEAALDEKLKVVEAKIEDLQKPQNAPKKPITIIPSFSDKDTKHNRQISNAETKLFDLQTAINEQLRLQLNEFKKEKARPLYEEGLNHLRNSKYSCARESFQKALAIYSEYTEVQKGLEDITKAEEIEFHLAEGQYYYQEKEYQKAKDEFNEAAKLDYKNQQARNYLHKIEKELEQKIRTERLARERERERLQKEQARLAEKERKAKERALAELRKKKAEAERQEEVRLKKEQAIKAKEDRLAQLKAEKEAKQKAREEELARAKAEKEQKLAQLKAEKEAKEKAHEEKLAKLKAEEEKKEQERQRKIELHYTQGKRHFKNKNYIAARKEFKDILVLDSKNKYALNALEKVHETEIYEQKEYARKQKERKEAEEEKCKGLINQHLAQGKIYLHQEEFNKAIKEFGQVLAVDAQNSAAEKYILHSKKQLVEARRQEQARLKEEQERKAKEDRLAQLKAEKEAKQKAREEELARAKAEKEQKLAQLKAEREEKTRLKKEAELKRQEEVRLKKEQAIKAKEDRLAQLKAEREEKTRLKKEAEARRQEQARLRKEELHQLELKKEAKELALKEAVLKLKAEKLRLERERLLRLKAEKEEEARLKKEAEAKRQEETSQKEAQKRQKQKQQRLHFAQGKVNYYRHNYIKAIEEFEQALIIDPNYGPAGEYILKCQEAIEEEKEKQLEFREKEAIQLQKTAKLIKEEEEQEKLEKIKDFYSKGKRYFRQGLYSDAINCFERVIELEGNPRIYYTPQAKELIEKAKVKEDEQKKDQAEEIAEEEVKQRKEKEGQKETAKERAEEEVQARGEEIIRQHYNSGRKYYRQGNYPMAIAELNKVSEFDSSHSLVDSAEKYITKARQKIMQYEEKQMKVEMKKELEQLDEEAIFGKTLLEQARWYYKRGDYAQTIKVCKLALEKDPLNEKARKLLYTAEEKESKKEQHLAGKEKDLDEKAMLARVERYQVLPDEEILPIPVKEFVPIVKLPKIREKLKTSITVDFRDVDLNYVLNFLADSAGVNIIPASGVSLEAKKVTIKMKDISIEKALKYILKNQGLTYRIEEDAVWVASPSEMEKEEVLSRVYFLNRGSGMFTEFDRVVGTGTGLGGAGSISKVTTLKDILEEAVEWPKNSKIVLDDRSGALIISNTPSNIQIIEDILYNLDISPVQVLIEARFVELQVTDVEELGIEWQLNESWGHRRKDGSNIEAINSGAGVDFTSFSRATEGMNFTYQGLLTYPQFQAVLHALAETQRAKTLSAPRVTTVNNQMASIKVVDEWIYPTRYEFQVVQSDVNGDGDFDDSNETTYNNVPVDFVTKDVGILLHVTPNVGADGRTINLALVPEVSEGTAGFFSYTGSVSLPKFSSRSLSTSVVINNGETVALGGLVKESTTTTLTKVPLLGDIPILGNLFRKKNDSIVRTNLLIFVTASIISPSGERIETVQQLQ